MKIPPEFKKKFIDLMGEIKYMGLKATGLAFVTSDNRILSYKDSVDADEFLEKDYIKSRFEEDVHTIIGHCRFPTKGDPINNRNNHPFSVGNTTIVHQGILVNDEKLMEKYGFEAAGETDSWVIAHTIDYYRNKGFTVLEAIAQTHSELQGSWAVVVIDKLEPEKLYLFCHNKSFNVMYLPKEELFMFSTEDKKLTDQMVDTKNHFGYFKEVNIHSYGELKIGNEDCLVIGDKVELYELPKPLDFSYNWYNDRNNKGRKNKKINLPENNKIQVFVPQGKHVTLPEEVMDRYLPG